MTLRVTQNTFFLRTVAEIRRSYSRLYESQARAAAGTRLLRPSDDPAAAARALALKSDEARLEQFRDNASHARTLVDTAAAELQSLSALVAQARERVVAASNGTVSQLDRRVLAEEIDQLLAQAVGIANSRLGDRYLFAGGRTSSPPFVAEANSGDGSTAGVRYEGTSDVLRVGVAPALSFGINLPGSRIFQPVARGRTLFETETGAVPGTGTDSGIGTATLLVTHGATTLGDGALPGGGDTASGLRPGASSAALDTVIGSHSLALVVDGSGSAGTVSLDGGPAIAFTSADTDLEVADATGGTVIRLDLSALTPSFTGTVSVSATGFLSTDGGATSVAIDFSSNQTVVDSRTGRTTNVDSSAVFRAGEAVVTYTGTSGLFETLIGIRDDLRNDRGASVESQTASLGRRLADLDRVHQSVLEALSDLGGRSAGLELVQTRLDDLKLGVADRLSETAGLDLPTAVAELQRHEEALELALQVGARLDRPTLFDFLR